MRIVELGPGDWDVVSQTVLALYAELGEEARDLGALDETRVRVPWSERPETMRVLAARDDDGTLLGMLTLTEGFAIYANGAYGIIPEMYVVKEARSRGVGAALVAAAAAIGRERGWKRIEVTGPESERSARAVAFYRRCGFTTAGLKLKLPL